jgi:nicotinamide phosphoribosyltransferase
MTIRNPILATDSYKFSHFMQYPKGATDVSSYIEARGTKIEGVTEVVFFGLQMYINEVLRARITMEHVNQAANFCAKHGTPFNREGWEIIVNDHFGYLPVTIEAVPEGTPVPLHNVMVQVHTNDERLPWLTSYIETMLLSYIWYGSTVATVSREIKKVIKYHLDLTSDNPEAELPFKLHDFGFRGVAAGAADLGGLAHLVNFMGTDTVAGIEAAMAHYGADVCGFSISASEHSTMTSWGRESEYEAYQNMVEAYAKPGAIFACVIDSYDTYNAIKLWAQPQRGNKSLLEQVKEAGATVVLRPDSGDPVQMPIDVIKLLIAEVGAKKNTKGYLVLPDYVRVIQGDGIDIDDVKSILGQLAFHGVSASNIAFGMGGGLLQKVNRDTFKFAMKANAIEIYGEWHDVKKDPVTATDKVSKAGRLSLLQNKVTGEYKTVRVEEAAELRKNGWYPAMRVVYNTYKSDMFYIRNTLDMVRKNAEVK